MKHSTCLLIGLGILIIIILLSVNYSYKNTNKIESFYTKTNIKDIINRLNTDKDTINKISKSLKARYVLMPSNEESLNNYIPSEKYLARDFENNLQQQFNINFNQHLQDEEIEQLEKKLQLLENKKKSLANNTSKSSKLNGLKSITTGSVLDIGYYDDGEYDFIKQPKFSLVINKDKDNCVQYLPSKTIDKNNEVETVTEVGCDYDINTNDQKFSYQKIKGNNDYNAALHPDYKNYEVASYYKLNNYPFYLIHPFVKKNNSYKIDKTECITLNNDGLSIEPCNLKESQRFSLT